jgi:hypothetical protein
VNEQAEGRSFNLESFSVHHNDNPSQVVIGFRTVATGAEQLEPFTVSLTLGGPAARQLTEELNAAIAKDERRLFFEMTTRCEGCIVLEAIPKSAPAGFPAYLRTTSGSEICSSKIFLLRHTLR